MSARRFYKYNTEEEYQNVKDTLPIPHIVEVNGEIYFKSDLEIGERQVIAVQKGYNILENIPLFINGKIFNGNEIIISNCNRFDILRYDNEDKLFIGANHHMFVDTKIFTDEATSYEFVGTWEEDESATDKCAFVFGTRIDDIGSGELSCFQDEDLVMRDNWGIIKKYDMRVLVDEDHVFKISTNPLTPNSPIIKDLVTGDFIQATVKTQPETYTNDISPYSIYLFNNHNKNGCSQDKYAIAYINRIKIYNKDKVLMGDFNARLVNSIPCFLDNVSGKIFNIEGEYGNIKYKWWNPNTKEFYGETQYK